MAHSAFALPPRHLGCQGIQVRSPEMAEAIEPGVNLAQWITPDGVQASGSFRPDGCEPSLA
jgi:hypothetical protein